MKTIKTYVFGMAFMLFPLFGAMAQSPTTYQNWQALPDSPTHLEVSWCTCQCTPSDADEIRLFVFNESGNARTADFTLTVSDQGQADVTYNVSNLNLSPGSAIQADCGGSAPSELSTNVPTGFNPSTLSISITYNN